MTHESALNIAQATANSSVSVNFEGKWKNQMDSVMELHVSGNDVLGSYTSNNSGQASGGPVTGPIKGWTAGDLLSFSVLWPGGSITSWTGQLVSEGEDKIRTLWQLVTEIADADEHSKLWKSTLTGADEFVRDN